MERDYDDRTGRPQRDGRDIIEELSEEELEIELTIAVVEARRRSLRLDALIAERARRSKTRRMLGIAPGT